MFSAMFDEDKKLKVYIPVLFFLGAVIISAFFYGQFLQLQMEELYPVLAAEYGNDFVIFFKETMGTQSAITIIFGCIGMFASPFLTALLVTCLIIFICKVFFKSEMKFKRIYVFMLYTSIISIVGSVITIIISVLAGASTNLFSLSIFMNPDQTMFIYNFLTSINIFSILEYILIFIGINYYAKLEDNNGKIAAAICIIIMLAAIAGLAMMATGNPADQYKLIYDMYQNTL